MKHRTEAGDEPLDQAAIQAWQASLAHLPPGIRRQLRPQAATRPRPALAWPLAAACAAGALAIGLHLQREPSIPVAPIAAGNGDEAATAWSALEQAPDFYLWLASADTAALELE
jgi:hypothetical protein